MGIDQYEGFKDETIPFLIEKREMLLKAQFEGFQLIHHRALILGSVLLASGNSLLIYSIQQWESARDIFITGVLGSAYILICAFFFFWTIRPVNFLRGGEFEIDIFKSKEDKNVKRAILVKYESNIEKNNQILSRVSIISRRLYFAISVFPIAVIIFWLNISGNEHFGSKIHKSEHKAIDLCEIYEKCFQCNSWRDRTTFYPDVELLRKCK